MLARPLASAQHAIQQLGDRLFLANKQLLSQKFSHPSSTQNHHCILRRNPCELETWDERDSSLKNEHGIPVYAFGAVSSRELCIC